MEVGIKDGVKYTVISEIRGSGIDLLLDIYKVDKRKAKIIFENQKLNEVFYIRRDLLYEYPNGDFRFVTFMRKFGISKTNIIYHREVSQSATGLKNGKHYSFYGKLFNQLNSTTISNFGIDTFKYNFYLKRYPWLRNVFENPYYSSVPIDFLIKHKLFTLKRFYRHIFKTTYPVASFLSKGFNRYGYQGTLKNWSSISPNLINIENLSESTYNNQFFRDTALMANSLGIKVNCSWSNKRLKLEHDKMAKEIIAVILEFEPLRDLNIGEVFLKFHEYSGFQIFRTNHELIEEGKMMAHCVGTYSGNVDNGGSAIFRYDGHTIQLGLGTKLEDGKPINCLRINQIQGFSNADAPMALKLEITKLVNEFNSSYFNSKNHQLFVEVESWNDDLPF